MPFTAATLELICVATTAAAVFVIIVSTSKQTLAMTRTTMKAYEFTVTNVRLCQWSWLLSDIIFYSLFDVDNT